MYLWRDEDTDLYHQTIAARNVTTPDAWRDVRPVKRERLAQMYGTLPSQPARAGDLGYEPSSLPPTVPLLPDWARLLVRFVLCGAVLYAAMVLLPIVGEWVRRVWR